MQDPKFRRAVAAHKAGDPAAAEAIYREIAVADRANAEVRHLLAIVRMQRDDPKEAVELARAATALAPREAKYANTLGAALAMTGDEAAAANAFRRAFELDSSLLPAALNHAEACVRAERLDEAEAAYRRALDASPDEADALTGLADLLALTGRDDEAVAKYRRADRVRPGRRDVLERLAETLDRLGRDDEAAETRARIATAPA